MAEIGEPVRRRILVPELPEEPVVPQPKTKPPVQVPEREPEPVP